MNYTKNVTVALLISMIGGMAYAKVDLEIAFVDTFKAMRECSKGEAISKELDVMRDRMSKEIQEEAQRITKEENDLKSKAATIKPEVLAKNERELAKQKRALEEKVRESEEEIKIAMQQKTEELMVDLDEVIKKSSQERNVDVVIDKTTGRVMYAKDDNKGDITSDVISSMNKKTLAASKEQPKKATAAA